MTVQSITQSLAELRFFKDMPREHLEMLAGCASPVAFKKGEFLLLVGHEATHFVAIREGMVALEMEAANKITTLQTIGEGSIVGWSWLVPPYTWHYDARAATPVSAIQFDARCVRDLCESNPAFGYDVLKHFSHVIVERLMNTRIQLADMYH